MHACYIIIIWLLFITRMQLPLGDRLDLKAHLSSLYAPKKGKVDVSVNDVLHIVLITTINNVLCPLHNSTLWNRSLHTLLSLPDVCKLAPVHGKAFCAQHCKVMEKHSPPIPTDIRGTFWSSDRAMKVPFSLSIWLLIMTKCAHRMNWIAIVFTS